MLKIDFIARLTFAIIYLPHVVDISLLRSSITRQGLILDCLLPIQICMKVKQENNFQRIQLCSYNITVSNGQCNKQPID